MAELNRDRVHRELLDAPADFQALLSAATPDALRRRTNGTRWTNREMLFHLLFGYLVVRTLLPLVWLMSRLPPGVGRGFAAVLNSLARPFHVVNTSAMPGSAAARNTGPATTTGKIRTPAVIAVLAS